LHEIIKTLHGIGPIIHWTMCPAEEAFGGKLACPPIITVRYQQPAEALAAFLRRAVANFQGMVAWEFSTEFPNWVLLPLRIRKYTRANKLWGGLEAARELMTKEPDFGYRANAELPRLAEHLQQQIA
jgi:hypothetical protein